MLDARYWILDPPPDLAVGLWAMRSPARPDAGSTTRDRLLARCASGARALRSVSLSTWELQYEGQRCTTATHGARNHPEKIDDPTTSAIGTLEWFLNARSTVIFSLSPFESRDKGEFTTPVNFAGSTFPSDTEIRSSWLMYDLSATYAYSLTPDSRFKTQIGAGLSYQHTRTELQMADTKVSARVTDDSLIPFLYGALDLELTDKWLLTSQVGGSQLSSDSYLFGDIGVLYRLDDHWDLGLGVGYYNREIDTGGLDNNIEYHLAYLSLSYSFY